MARRARIEAMHNPLLMRGKLNLFQATMLRWRELHPYSAVHVVRVARPCEPQRLRDRIEALLESTGLTGLTLDRRRARFEFRGGPAAIELRLAAGGADPLRAVQAEIERELNTPFPQEGTFSPLRFFAVDAGPSFHLGLAYDHFLAGGDSIAVLLRHCLDAYSTEAPGGARAWLPRLYPRTYRRLFLRHLVSAVRGLAEIPVMAASCRRSWRAPCRVDRPADNGFLCHRLGRAALDTLKRTAKSWEVTLNDLLLAILLRSLAPLAGERLAAARRREIGVAAIVNLRGELESDAESSFGQFLSSLRISHPVPAAMSLRELAGEVRAETSRIKAGRLYLQTLLALGAAGLGWRLLSVERRRRFLAKHYPLLAGITTLHVDPLWEGMRRDPTLQEYLRGVSTGPLAPLVFAFTTLGETMWLGVSFREADVDRTVASAAAQEFVDCIKRLA
jgi:hypothetical protein